MMDMEMNAELERDGGSETGEASSEGSSAGSVYCTLEQDFAKITSEMKGNVALAPYEAEYTRLFESLYRAQRLEEELTEKCRLLRDEVDEGSTKIFELEQKIEIEAASAERLRDQLLEGKKLADSAHTREQKAQEVIEKLRVSISKLNEEITLKNRQLASDEHTSKASSKQKDGSKEREQMLNEIETLKQRLKKLGKQNENMQQRMSETEQRLNELQETYDRQSNELANERREKEKLEVELQTSQHQLTLRLSELQSAEERLATGSIEAAKRESQLQELQQQNDDSQKEIQKLMLKQMSMRMESDRLQIKSEEIRKELAEKTRNQKDMAREIDHLKEDLKKVRAEKESATKKMTKERMSANRAEENLNIASSKLRSAELEITSLKRQLLQEKKNIEKLGRDKENAQKNAQALEDSNKKLSLEIRVFEQTNRKLELSVDDMTENIADLQRQIKSLEKERDRCSVESQELRQKVEDYIDEVKMKRLEISEQQKLLIEAEGKFRQQQSLFEEVRSERNSFKKNLLLAQDELGQAKAKVKSLSEQVDQMREQLSQKEAALLKQEFLFGKTEKEKEALRGELADCRKTVGDLHVQMHEQRQEEKKLRGNLHEADTQIKRQTKEIESVMSERDIIGSQLVRRNDEMSLLSNKLQILQESLSRGEHEYARRLQDIRMLKLEVKKLRLDKQALERNGTGLKDMRNEVFHLERQLAAERLKVSALEDDLQNPLNVHRWRSLEATDPGAFEMLRKYHFLQKRLLNLSAQLIAKDKQINHIEKLYMNLREMIAKQPGPELLVCLNKTRKVLRDRSNKIKCLVAELNITSQGEQKFEMNRIKRELTAMKTKYLTQKKKLQMKSSKENRPSLQEPSGSDSKFYGGGFNLCPPIGKSPLITINK